ncbi:MAG: tyrosine-protein phosphatase [Bacteroidales bacterium]|nr:tyrosine-protein phosphatase [Bacteroidales bacterium]
MKRKLIALMLVLPLLCCCGNKEDENEPNGEEPTPVDEYTGPEQGSSDWSVIGTLLGSNWDTDYVMAGTGEEFVLKNVKLAAEDAFKIRYKKTWENESPNRGGSFAALNTAFDVTHNGADIKPGLEGIYDIYYNAGVEQMAVCESGKTTTWKENTPPTPPDPVDDLDPEIHNGDRVLAPNPNAEKFLTEVTYPDHDYSYSKVLDYYGGFNGKLYDENGNPDPNGSAIANPKSDKPSEYTIRWTKDDAAGDMVFRLTDEIWGWSAEETVQAGDYYVNVTNLVPNTHYSYSVTSTSGKVMTSGSFDTYGHVHQIFFKSRVRNGRDLGGWKTYDGKMVRYRMLYRGGRFEASTLAKSGKRALLNEGIKAQLDLRGKSDVLTAPAIEGLAFCAPVIETGGDTMLKTYKEQTRQCVQFAIDCAKNNLPLYFHCSLGRDRTGTFALLMLGVLDVIEGDISKEYELTYFAPFSWSVSEGEQSTTPYVFRNLRTTWAYKPAAEVLWGYVQEGERFSDGVARYFREIGISQEDIDAYREIMLVDPK